METNAVASVMNDLGHFLFLFCQITIWIGAPKLNLDGIIFVKSRNHADKRIKSFVNARLHY